MKLQYTALPWPDNRIILLLNNDSDEGAVVFKIRPSMLDEIKEFLDGIGAELANPYAICLQTPTHKGTVRVQTKAH